MKVSKTNKGFHISKNEKEEKIEAIKNKSSVTNTDIKELLLMILEELKK